jgi:hypothetical protein
MHYGSGGRKKGIGRDKDILPFHTEGPEYNLKRACATAHRHGMAASAELRKVFLELCSVPAESELARCQDFTYPFGDPRTILGEKLDSCCGDFILRSLSAHLRFVPSSFS